MTDSMSMLSQLVSFFDIDHIETCLPGWRRTCPLSVPRWPPAPQGRATCRLVVSPRLLLPRPAPCPAPPCPGPCPPSPPGPPGPPPLAGLRGLAVGYKCRPASFRSRVSCPGEAMELACPPAHRCCLPCPARPVPSLALFSAATLSAHPYCPAQGIGPPCPQASLTAQVSPALPALPIHVSRKSVCFYLLSDLPSVFRDLPLWSIFETRKMDHIHKTKLCFHCLFVS
jgi:hypothetical protein